MRLVSAVVLMLPSSLGHLLRGVAEDIGDVATIEAEETARSLRAEAEDSETAIWREAAATTRGFQAFFTKNVEGPGIHKWHHYFPTYEQEFSRHCGAGAVPAKMIEIGIQSGGSMRMWRACFGENLEVLVGVDVNANTKAWERFGDEPGSRPGNVHVEVGSQADPAVFKDIDAKYPGGFDIILDDGSHVNTHMVASFRAAWRLLRPGQGPGGV